MKSSFLEILSSSTQSQMRIGLSCIGLIPLVPRYYGLKNDPQMTPISPYIPHIGVFSFSVHKSISFIIEDSATLSHIS